MMRRTLLIVAACVFAPSTTLAAPDDSAAGSTVAARPTIVVVDAAGTECFTAGSLLIRLSRRPDTRVAVSLDARDGRSIQLAWDPANASDLTRIVTPIAGDGWTPSASGDRTAIPTPDGRSTMFLQYQITGACNTAKQVWTATAKLAILTVSLTDAGWKDVDRAGPLTITISNADAVVRSDATSRLAETAIGADLGVTARGLGAAVPDAVRDVLSMLAEIAVDRAKAEATRLFKQKVITYVCDSLTRGVLRGDKDPAALLPATCGQLDQIRITDLGASARGLFAALKSDLTSVVMPELLALAFKKLGASTEWAAAQRRAVRVAKIMTALVRRSMHGGLRGDDVRVGILELVAELEATTGIPARWQTLATRWKPVFETALVCAAQGCALADVIVQLEAAATAAGLAPDRRLVAVAQRVLAVLQPPVDMTARDQARELIDIVFDIAQDQCGDDALHCSAAVDGLRDISVGLLDDDYTRAIGGVSAMLRLMDLRKRLKGKPFELASSVISYVRTYQDTQGQDAKTAHELRRKALEGIIDASTDRSGRAGDFVVSLGASVGYTVGRQIVPYGAYQDRERTLHDLRLPLGITVQRLANGGSSGGGPFVHASVADLAQFAASPIVTGEDVDQVRTWSDFVSPGLQVGIRLFNDRVPLILGLDVSWMPRVRFADAAGATQTTSVGRVGVFAGFNVPFFDLN